MNTGLSYPYVYSLAIDPVTPSTLYAGTYGGGVFKSVDGGSSWSAINTGLSNTNVYSLAIDPFVPSTLYAGTIGGGVFKSVDGGSNWSAINTGLSNPYVCSLAIDPVTPSTLYAGTNGGVFKSVDGGSSWSAMNTGLSNTYVWSLAIDPVTPSTLYAGTNGGGVFKSVDGGSSWSAINTGLSNPYVMSLAIDPVTPSTLYAGTNGGGVFKSVDGGSSWSAMNTGLSNLTVLSLAIDPVTPAMLYAGTNGNGAFEFSNSTNGSPDFTIVGDTSVTFGNSSKIMPGTAGPANVASNGTFASGALSSIEGNVQSIGQMTLGNSARALMDVATNGMFNLGSLGFIGGDVNSGADVSLSNGARVDGDVTAAGDVILGKNATVVGTVTPFGTPDSVSNALLPDCPAIVLGGDDLTTRSNTGPHYVLTGDHGDYIFGGGNTVVFETGVYSFLSLKFGSNTKIEIQAPVTIHIADELVFGNGVKQTLISGEAKDVIYRIDSGGLAKTGKLNEIFGTICGPDAVVNILSGTSLKGAVYADTVTFGANVEFTADPADAADLQ